MPGFHNLSSVILKLQDSHSAHTFRLFLIRMHFSICRQLYRNNASTFRKLERCQQQFGRLSWSWTVPSSFI